MHADTHAHKCTHTHTQTNKHSWESYCVETPSQCTDDWAASQTQFISCPTLLSSPAEMLASAPWCKRGETQNADSERSLFSKPLVSPKQSEVKYCKVYCSSHLGYILRQWRSLVCLGYFTISVFKDCETDWSGLNNLSSDESSLLWVDG